VPTLDVQLPAGEGCEFPLHVVSDGDRVEKKFTDKTGKFVRIIEAGQGWQLTFTNEENGSTLVIKPNGSVRRTTNINPNGSSTVTSTGHNILIFFPTDVPTGPSTIQYVGRVVYKVDPNGVFTLRQATGKQNDICAALSG
jgi:hypothetical protein